MFWGLIMEPQKRYSQVVKKSFHVSMAALDLCSCSDEPVQVMCGYDNRKYLMCTLQKDGILQVPLDLHFETGDEVSFVTNGSSHVHLTGYLNEDDLADLDDLAEEEEEEEDTEEEEIKIENISNSNIVTGKRAKKINSDLQLDGLASKINKRLDDIANGAPPAKKTKTAKLLEEFTSRDDESDDSDVSLSDLINKASDDDDEEDTTFAEDDDDESDLDDEEDGGEDAEDDDDDDEDDEDAEGDDEEMADSDEGEVSSMSEDEEVKPKMNGTAKKNKQETNQKAKTKQENNKKAEKVKANDVAKKPQVKNDQPGSPQKKSLEGGVMIEDLKVGDGQLAKSGKMVQVYYEGRLKSNNKMFDSANKGNGFKFRLGRQEVIKGWDVGVAGMKVGGKRRITCPPNMAYGAKGAPPTIPPNSSLVFEVELKNIK